MPYVYVRVFGYCSGYCAPVSMTHGGGRGGQYSVGCNRELEEIVKLGLISWLGKDCAIIKTEHSDISSHVQKGKPVLGGVK
jgi:hypothetical protein